MNIEQKLANYEISEEDCLKVQGGCITPEVFDLYAAQGESYTIMLVEEAEKPENSV